MKSSLELQGDIYFTITKENGEVEKHHRKNRVVMTGIELLINRFLYSTGSAPDVLALGSGTTANTGLETALVNQLFTGTINNFITTLTPPIGGTFQVHGTVTATGAANITEVGCLAGGVLFARSVFPATPITMQATDIADIAWVFSINSV